MTTTHPELHTSRQFQGLIFRAHPTSGTETPEEFEIDERDKLGRPEDEDTEENEDETVAPES